VIVLSWLCFCSKLKAICLLYTDRSTSSQWSIVLGVVNDELKLNDLLANISAAGFELEELEKVRLTPGHIHVVDLAVFLT